MVGNEIILDFNYFYRKYVFNVVLRFYLLVAHHLKELF